MTDTALIRLRRDRLFEQRARIRSSKDYSQAGPAEALGVSRMTYSELEKHPERLTLAQAQTLAEFFGMDSSEFQKILAEDVETLYN